MRILHWNNRIFLFYAFPNVDFVHFVCKRRIERIGRQNRSHARCSTLVIQSHHAIVLSFFFNFVATRICRFHVSKFHLSLLFRLYFACFSLFCATSCRFSPLLLSPLDFSHLFSFPFAQGRSCFFRGVVYLHIKRFFLNSVCQHCSSRSFLRELFCSRFFLYIVLVSSSTRPVGQKPNDHTTLKKNMN